MSKRKKQGRSANAYDCHHLLWMRRDWETGYARALRSDFTRRIPVELHRELHRVVPPLPVPPVKLCREAYETYLREKEVVDSYDPARACAWLYVHIPDANFRAAIQKQIDFFATRSL